MLLLVRRVATVVLLLILAVTPVVHSRPSTVSVLQMNLCNSGWAGCFTGWSPREAAAVIRAQQPDVVSLNEICRRDVFTLARELDGGHATATFQPARDRRTGGPVRCRDGEPYGIGVVVRSRTGPVAARGGTYPVQDPTATEERAWTCAPSPRGFTACTTHLANANPLIALAQCHHLFAEVVGRLAGPVVVGGDFNLAALTTCLPDGFRAESDGGLQYVVTGPAARGTARVLGLRGTDHPALLVSRVQDRS